MIRINGTNGINKKQKNKRELKQKGVKKRKDLFGNFT